MKVAIIGLGAMGFHAYLQKNMVPFESAIASAFNEEIFSHIKSEADTTTRKLAVERGACPDDDTASVRNAHLLAIAPNASSSILCGNTSWPYILDMKNRNKMSTYTKHKRQKV